MSPHFHSCRQFEVDQAARSGEQMAAVFARTEPEQVLDGFLHAWYGLRLPAVESTPDGPRLLRRLQALNRSHPVIGAEDHLFQPEEQSTDSPGLRTFYAYCGGSYFVAYSDEQPPVAYGSNDLQTFRPLGVPLDEFLVQQVLVESISGAEAVALGETDDLPRVLRHLAHGFVECAAPNDDAPVGRTYGVFAAEHLLVYAFGDRSPRDPRSATIWAGAHDEAHLMGDPIYEMVEWYGIFDGSIEDLSDTWPGLVDLLAEHHVEGQSALETLSKSVERYPRPEGGVREPKVNAWKPAHPGCAGRGGGWGCGRRARSSR